MAELKKYPEESKARLDKMLEETKSTREILDGLDRILLNTPSNSLDVKDIARQAVGAGNYLRKKWSLLTAAVVNEKSNRYMELKLEASTTGTKFVDAGAKEEAEGYVAPLRTARNVLEAYVISADNIVSFCRMNLRDQYSENTSVQVTGV